MYQKSKDKWVVLGYSEGGIIGTFDTEEEAKAHCDKANEKIKRDGYYTSYS